MKKILCMLCFVVCFLGSVCVEFYKFSDRTSEKDFFIIVMFILVFVHNVIWIWNTIKFCKQTKELEKQGRAWLIIMILVSWISRHCGNIYIYFAK